MDKTKFLTIYPTFERLDIVREVLPSIIAETEANDARLIVHDCSVNRADKWAYLQELQREYRFFLILSDNMSMAHSRNMCLHLGLEMFAPDYIMMVEDDHGLKPGALDGLMDAMDGWFGVKLPNGLRAGMFTICYTDHGIPKIRLGDSDNHCPANNTEPLALGGLNSCCRCAPVQHWVSVLKGYDTDEYLISNFQTTGLNARNYHKGFSVVFVGGGALGFEIKKLGRGETDPAGIKRWDRIFCASDPRSNFQGKR